MAAENGILGRGEDVGVARRNVLKRSGALAAAWVIGTVGLAAHAQQRDRPRKIGVIMNYAENDLEGQARFSALREQLHKLGSVDGNNTQIEVRWAAGKSDLMLAFATQFVSQPVDVIVVNSTPRYLQSCPLVTQSGSGQEYRLQFIRLLWLDVGRTDYLSPLIDFVGDEFAEFGRRVRKNEAASLSKASFEIWIRESRTNLLIELFNDFSRRVFGCTNTDPTARLVARHKIGHQRYLGELRQAQCGGYRQWPQLTGFDELD